MAAGCWCTCCRSRVSACVVAAVYVVIVLGLGQRPADAGDREILGLSMLAAAVAAVGYLPARDRLTGLGHPVRLRGAARRRTRCSAPSAAG